MRVSGNVVYLRDRRPKVCPHVDRLRETVRLLIIEELLAVDAGWKYDCTIEDVIDCVCCKILSAPAAERYNALAAALTEEMYGRWSSAG